MLLYASEFTSHLRLNNTTLYALWLLITFQRTPQNLWTNQAVCGIQCHLVVSLGWSLTSRTFPHVPLFCV
jgi:hypothetical protein